VVNLAVQIPITSSHQKLTSVDPSLGLFLEFLFFLNSVCGISNKVFFAAKPKRSTIIKKRKINEERGKLLLVKY